ncbi:hypothetical protein E3U55_15550 [Filobacillus milosensis]|uniref:Integrase n=1 Tax=Filobacillus milosensis TaxID=94137 RepID=A0A4Y8ICI2_9BACI|nr:tyrosine-type recombinase/integrase [Filobacillus milosensis]TFB13671.1 hypothetical protein E3U55_15550 [Filobacillus milosensis]
MPIQRQTQVDYEVLCYELGVTVEELLELVKKKDIHLSKKLSSVSLNQVIDEYNDNLARLRSTGRRSESTLNTYRNFLKRVKDYVLTHYPDLQINEFNENTILEILEKSQPRKSETLAANTLNKYMAIMRSMLGYAFESGYTDKDLKYKLPIQTDTSLPRYLNDEQVEKVLKGALQKTYGYRKRAMLIFLLGTGCRVSELTNLKLEDFNMDENIIFIRKGKGNKERYVPIFKEVKNAITQYLKISGVTEWKPGLNGYLFSQDEGHVREKKVLDRSVQYLVRGLFDDIGLGKNYTVHSFRHTFAVNCLKFGMKESYLMQILGHEDPHTTAKYTKLFPADLKEEIMKGYPFPFEKLLNELI